MSTDVDAPKRPKRRRRKAPAWLDGRVTSAIVFAISVVALGVIEVARAPNVTVPAIAWAAGVEHPAPAETTVARVHVRLGENVQAGDPLVTLDGSALNRQLIHLDLQVLIAIQESQVAQATLVHESSLQSMEVQTRLRESMRDAQTLRSQLEGEEVALSAAETEAARLGELASERLAPRESVSEASRRALTARLNRQLTATQLRGELGRLRVLRTGSDVEGEELVSATARLHEKQLELLQSQREELTQRIDRLEVRASSGGIVASVLGEGASVSVGVSVARLVPPRATEVVAYLPPETNPADAAAAARVLIAQSDGSACAGELERRVGAEVTAVPGAGASILAGAFGGPSFGLPIHISLPAECQLGVGQRVWVSLEAH